MDYHTEKYMDERDACYWKAEAMAWRRLAVAATITCLLIAVLGVAL